VGVPGATATSGVGRWKRWPGNIGILVINTLAVRVLFPTAAVGVALISQAQGWGLLNVTALPRWLVVAAAAVLLDLAIYFQHVANLTRAEYQVLLRHDFATFAMRCFHDLNPQTELAMSWHLEVIAAKLTAVREGKIRRLIINLPPRHLKSMLASIAFPAWCLGRKPSAQLLCVSYAQDLADKLARDCRSIMMSPWYRQLFATHLAPHRQAVQEFITTRQGYRLATSTGGVLTGRGADIILIDDPLKPDEALSDTQRQACNEWFDHTLYSRLNDKRNGAIVIIMQRLHEDDLVGHVLAQEPWEVVSFPAIAEADEVHHIETIWGAQRFTRHRGEALHPEREPLDTLDRIRRTIGEYHFAGQYQQSPPHSAVAWLKPNGSSAIERTNCQSTSTASCRAGTPPTR
jgi:hypothetical protein